jgi:predicted XRE-type DNA-binding protein
MDKTKVREQLSKAVVHLKEDNSLSYSDLVDLVGTQRSTISKIIKNKGQGVSIELMEEIINKFDWKVQVELIPLEGNEFYHE